MSNILKTLILILLYCIYIIFCHFIWLSDNKFVLSCLLQFLNTVNKMLIVADYYN